MLQTFARSSLNNICRTKLGRGINAGLLIAAANVFVNSIFVTSYINNNNVSSYVEF